MDEFIKLMDEFWILRENDRENYFKIKRMTKYTALFCR